MSQKLKELKKRVHSWQKSGTLVSGLAVALSAPLNAQNYSAENAPKETKTEIQAQDNKVIDLFTQTITLGYEFKGNVRNLTFDYTRNEKAFYDGKNNCIIVYQFDISDENAYYAADKNRISLDSSTNHASYNEALQFFSNVTHTETTNLTDAEKQFNLLNKTKLEGKRSERKRATFILNNPIFQKLQNAIKLKKDLKLLNQTLLNEEIINHENTHKENRKVIQDVLTAQYPLTPENMIKSNIADELASCLSENPHQENNTQKTIERFDKELWQSYEKKYNSDYIKTFTNMTSYKIIYAKSLNLKKINNKDVYSTESMDKNFDTVLRKLFNKFDAKTQDTAISFIKKHSLNYDYSLSKNQIETLRQDELPITYHQNMLENRFNQIKPNHYSNLTPYTYSQQNGFQKKDKTFLPNTDLFRHNR